MLISRQQVTKTETWEQQIYGNKFHVPLRLQAAWSAPQQAGVLVWVIYTCWHNGEDHRPEYMSRNYTHYRCHYMSMYNRSRYGTKYHLLHALCTFQQQVFSKVWAKQHPETLLDVEDSQVPWEGGQGPPQLGHFSLHVRGAKKRTSIITIWVRPIRCLTK